ncbi:MAG: MFS transporter [Acidobacteriota bacterium]
MKRVFFPKEIYQIDVIILLLYCTNSLMLLLPLFLKKLGATPDIVGIYVGIYFIFTFFSRPIIGWIIDVVNPKRILLTGLIFLSFFVFCYLVVKKLGFFLIFVRAGQGMSYSSILISLLLLAVIFSDETNRAHVLSILSIFFLLPNLFMPFIGEWIIEKTGFFLYFMFAFILCVTALIISSRIKFEWKRTESTKSRNFFSLIRNSKFLIVSIFSFFLGLGLSSTNTFVPLWIKNFPSVKIGFFFTSAALIAVLIRFFIGGRFKFWAKGETVLFSFYILGLGIFLTSYARGNPMVIISGLIYGGGMGFLFPNLLTMAVTEVDEKERGKALSIFTALIDLGFAIGPPISGWFVESFGYSEMFRSLSLLMIISSTFLYLIFKKFIKRRSSPFL